MNRYMQKQQQKYVNRS